MKIFAYLTIALSVFACDKLGVTDSGVRTGDVPVATKARPSSSQPSRVQQEQTLEQRRQELDKKYPHQFLSDDEVDRAADSAEEGLARSAADAVRGQNQARQAEAASARACREACNMSDDYGLCIRRCQKL